MDDMMASRILIAFVLCLLRATAHAADRDVGSAHLGSAGSHGSSPLITDAPSAQSLKRAESISALFKTIEKNSDPNWRITIDQSHERIPVGQHVTVNYRMTRPGYVYLLYIGSDNSDIRQLWPSAGSHKWKESAKGSLRLEIKEPRGMNRFLLFASDEQVDLSPLLLGENSTDKTGQNNIALACAITRACGEYAVNLAGRHNKRNVGAVTDAESTSVSAKGFSVDGL